MSAGAPSGSALDARVAAEVMGWTEVRHDEATGRWIGIPPDASAPEFVPAYSTDLGASWEVADRLSALGWGATTHLLADEYRLSVDPGGAALEAHRSIPVLCELDWVRNSTDHDRWTRLYHRPSAIADTPAVALCLAALDAVRVEPCSKDDAPPV